MATATAPAPKKQTEDLTLREIPQDHADVLRTMVGITNPDGSLPEGVVKSYWNWKRLADRVSCQPAPGDLVTIALLAGHGMPFIEELQKSIPTMFRGKEIAMDDPVDAMWRNKLQRGKFQGMAGNGNVLVLFDGQTEVRQVDPAKVFMPSAETETASE